MRAATLIALLATAACTSGRNDISMDGIWRLEGNVRAPSASCDMIGDFSVTGSTAEGFAGTGILTMTMRGTTVREVTDSAAVYPDRIFTATWPVGAFLFRQTSVSEPDLVSGTWTCWLDNTGGSEPAYVQGHWVMRRILREQVDAAPLMGPS